jgi:hypothetical protein
MKRFKVIKLIALILVVVVVGGLSLNFVQQSINDFFNPASEIEIHTLHRNDVASPNVIDFEEDIHVRENLLEDFTMEIPINEYREDLIFESASARVVEDSIIDVTFIGIALLLLIICVVFFVFINIRKYQEE